MWKTMKQLFAKKPVPVCQKHFYDIGNNGTLQNLRDLLDAAYPLTSGGPIRDAIATTDAVIAKAEGRP